MNNHVVDKPTLILGATTNKERYAYTAAFRLVQKGHTIIPVGIKKGEVMGVPIQNTPVNHAEIHTVTLYVGPQNQTPYFDLIPKWKPKRVIFNPGTENNLLKEHLEKYNIETIEACTLVMLATEQY